MKERPSILFPNLISKFVISGLNEKLDISFNSSDIRKMSREITQNQSLSTEINQLNSARILEELRSIKNLLQNLNISESIC
ncbi:hypothetical protein [Leptospira bandrabouensis]|uniref:hypothetical protein n=1 Tax=Leptospira bandrabouensis TaxID=2484903 RepID=UPI001EE912C2|nr:hypothetical protein [Leptospira bandrabouensis]MCG6146487.1 hypothetical protein [Leptospira bandrabouensis]MCG6161859.1 hypothetical protein [Leptospira bandrabouensis]MCG6166090.1 hypothetical protein [Leptospira bandrabouensis]